VTGLSHCQTFNLNYKKNQMLAGKLASCAMDGKFKLIPETWIPIIPAGMTIFETKDCLNIYKLPLT
jgi:hypothetical protein